MKRLIALILVSLSATVMAQYPHHNHRYGGWGYGWVAPTLIGGVVGYEIARNQAPVIVQQPVIVSQPQLPQTLIVPSPAPAGYHWAQMVNPQTNQYQLVLVPN